MKDDFENLCASEAYKMVIGEDENESSVDRNDIELRFSNYLASEFANTVNEFTQVCSVMVQKKTVDKDTFGRFSDLLTKIKNLSDAAKNSIS